MVEVRSPNVVEVPDLVGRPLEKARLILQNAGLAVDAVLFRESYEAQDTVLEQAPPRGQMIYEGSPVTLHVARRGYMELLPAIYRRSDAVGRNLVRDICFIFEHLFGSVEETLDRGHTFFDPYECPPEFLQWLASWTAMVVDVDWPEAKQRAILKRAVDLYRIRGTRRGIALFLVLFTGYEPEIRENEWPFSGFRIGVDARVGLDSVVLPPVDLAHSFIVTMPVSFEDVSPEMVIRIHEIIQMEKPAHTQYYLQFNDEQDGAGLSEFFAIGRQGIGVAEAPASEPATEPGTAPSVPELEGEPT